MTDKKKNKIKIFRLKAALPFAIIIALITVFNLLFLDGIVKKALVSFAEDKNGATVDLEMLDLTPLTMGMDMEGLQWTDRDRLTHNLFEISNIEFSMVPSRVFKKKFHISKVKLEGLRFRSERENPGELISGSSALEDDSGSGGIKGKASEVKEDFLGGIDKIDPKAIIDSYDMNFKEDAKALEKKVDERQVYWKGQVKTVSDTSAIKKDVDAVKKINPAVYKDPKKIPEAKKEIERIKNLKSSIEKKKKNLASTRTDLKKDMDGLKTEYSAIKQAKADGLQSILADLKFSDENLKNISTMIFGDSVTGKLFQIKDYYDRYNHYLPKGGTKKEAPEVPKEKRFRGYDVDFLGVDKTPNLFIKEIDLSGWINQATPLSGSIRDLSSDLSFRPMLIDMKGASANLSFGLDGRLARTEDDKKDNLIKLDSKNIKLKGSDIFKENQFIQSIDRGTADVKATITDDGETFRLNTELIGHDLAFTLKEINQKVMRDVLTQTLSSVKLLEAEMILTVVEKNGKKDSKLRFKSNLDKILNKKLKEYINKKVKAKKDQLIAEYNKKAADAMAPLEKKLGVDLGSGLDKSIKDVDSFKGILDSKQTEIEKSIKSAGASKATTQQKKATDAAKKKLPGKLF